MQALKDRILKDGRNLGDGILKVDSILNHQMDPCLIKEMGEEIARRFRHLEPTRVLTAEVSGIAPALMTALALNVPVVYARKKKPITMYGPVLLETAPTHTKGGHEVMLLVSAEFMPLGERVLIVDDFLATGHTLRALARIVRGGGCTLVGIAAVIEKSFEGGRALLESRYQVPIESLVTITSMDDDKIELA
ncbi:MAG: xanthine phosphoribosyltransferase [Anaerolineae bacterium]|nr:xanthine phosphoribosyltransferase [Anaerolineae bacterium]